jgi:formylglycine-generating enzyme required for sulfatase activity
VAETAKEALASVRQEGPPAGQKAEADQSVSFAPTIPLRDEPAGLAEPVKTEPTKPLEEKTEPQPLLAQLMLDKSRLQRIGILGAALLAVVLVGFAIRSFRASPSGPPPTEPPTAIQAPTEDVAAATEVPIVLPEATEASATPTSESPIDTETPTESSPSTTTPYPTEITDSKGVSMVFVQAGDFQMGYRKGDPDEKQVHTVDLAAYYIDKYEVTNALYRACEKDGGCKPPIKTGSATHNNYYGISGFVEYPVIYVDWNMANDYCGWRGARLPTEAEWEKAARGNLDDPPLYPWGNELSCETANYNDGHGGCNHDTQKVGTYESGKSFYGAYDMAGNVWEWVADRYSEAYYGTPFPINPTGPDSGQSRVLRGGAWNSGENDLRASNRRKYAPTYANFDTGFRCAVGISP